MTQNQSSKVSIVIPFYNEEKNVKKVLEAINADLEGIDYEILAVDNGSSDKTQGIIKKVSESNKRIKMIVVHTNRGYGYGVKKGLEEADGDFVGFVDGDLQVKPKEILKICEIMIEKDLDFCKGFRKIRDDPIQRKIASFFFNSIMNLFFRLKSKDVNAKPKFMKKTIYNKLDLTSNDWFIDSEILIKLRKRGIKNTEIPIRSSSRKEGVSHVRFNTIIEFLGNMLTYRNK